MCVFSRFTCFVSVTCLVPDTDWPIGAPLGLATVAKINSLSQLAHEARFPILVSRRFATKSISIPHPHPLNEMQSLGVDH